MFRWGFDGITICAVLQMSLTFTDAYKFKDMFIYHFDSAEGLRGNVNKIL
jgi:hypothetical protein